MSLPQPVLKPVPGLKRVFEFDQPWVVQLPHCRKWLTILPGFEIDGASIPRPFWWIVGEPMDSNFVAPAAAHDGLYAAELLPREDCDDEFEELMERNSKVSRQRARLFHWAVRKFGWTVWAGHTRGSVNHARMFCLLSEHKPEV